MSSIAEQLEAGRIGAQASAAIDRSARAAILETFQQWDDGLITNRQIRHRLENVVRGSYRATGAVGREQAIRAGDLEGWTPAEGTFSTPYLTSLLLDVRRNLREYGTVRTKKSSTAIETEKARRRALLNIQHSAGVASSRGYTDGLIAAHQELEDFGYRQIKVWMANFVGNVPCKYCRKLHGTRVGLNETFHVQISGGTRLAVYRDLQGPPRHPQCHCYLVILVITLENVTETIDIDQPEEEKDEFSSEGVRNLPLAIFLAIIAALRAVARFAKGG